MKIEKRIEEKRIEKSEKRNKHHITTNTSHIYTHENLTHYTVYMYILIPLPTTPNQTKTLYLQSTQTIQPIIKNHNLKIHNNKTHNTILSQYDKHHNHIPPLLKPKTL